MIKEIEMSYPRVSSNKQNKADTKQNTAEDAPFDLRYSVMRGSHEGYREAGELLNRVIQDNGEEYQFEFPDTAFYFPLIYAITGIKVKNLAQVRDALQLAKSRLYDNHEEAALSDVLSSGIAMLFSQEILLALRYIEGLEPVKEKVSRPIYNGFLSDSDMRARGIRLVDGRITGIVALIGAAPDDESAYRIYKELQSKNILTFLAGNTNGDSVARQLVRKGVNLIPSWDGLCIPLGPDIAHTLYALNWAIRVPMIFGGLKGGDTDALLKYTAQRVPAMAIVLGPLNDEIWATGAGTLNLGIPIVCSADVPEIKDAVFKEPDLSRIIRTALEIRGIKAPVDKPSIPISYGPVYEGERIRKEDAYVEFGGGMSPALERVVVRDAADIEDGEFRIVGNGWQERYDKGGVMPLGISIEIAGKNLSADLEPIIERKIHQFVNEGQGIWHMGQRDNNWIRISTQARTEGFEMKHIGKILYAMIHSSFKSLVDKVQITLLIDDDEVERMRSEAVEVWKERDKRLDQLSDESVDTFYSCLLCQSFASNHICVISPERPGLCGSYSWLDAKVSYDIDPSGGNQPIRKGETLDKTLGSWAGVNGFIRNATNGAIESMNAYSIMNDPMTSCGCFQCIVAIVPEANGVMIVERDFKGMTPIGMKFSTLAGSVGGGMQAPGFMGVGLNYITSKKFLLAEGGIGRIVWMNRKLKRKITDKFEARSAEEGMTNLLHKIADETIATDLETLLGFVIEVGHPAMKNESML